MNYLQLMKRRLSGEEKNIPGHLGGKKLIRDFCDLIGVKTVKIIKSGTIAEIEKSLEEMPEYFALKPAFASTSIGVYLLQKTEQGFLDLLKGERVNWEDIKKHYISISERHYPHNPERGIFIIEDLLIDYDGKIPPDDIRFYCFQGEVGLIIKEDHMTKGIVEAMYFDGNFLPFSDVHNRYSIAKQAEALESIVEAIVPDKWQDLLNVAKRVSCAVPTPFARIDLYDTPKGIYLGEVTLTPGTFYYGNRKIMSVSEQERLGRMWLEAEKRMAGSIGF